MLETVVLLKIFVEFFERIFERIPKMMYSKFKWTATFDQFNVSLLVKTINFVTL